MCNVVAYYYECGIYLIASPCEMNVYCWRKVIYGRGLTMEVEVLPPLIDIGCCQISAVVHKPRNVPSECGENTPEYNSPLCTGRDNFNNNMASNISCSFGTTVNYFGAGLRTGRHSSWSPNVQKWPETRGKASRTMEDSPLLLAQNTMDDGGFYLHDETTRNTHNSPHSSCNVTSM